MRHQRDLSWQLGPEAARKRRLHVASECHDFGLGTSTLWTMNGRVNGSKSNQNEHRAAGPSRCRTACLAVVRTSRRVCTR